MPFEDARETVQGVNLASYFEWRNWCRTSRPTFIPSNPDVFYRYSGWTSWIDFIGIPPATRFVLYEEAREYARSLELRTSNEWHLWCRKSGQRPQHIPAHPERFYKNVGWTSWYDFLGYMPRSPPPKRDPLPPGHRSENMRSARRAQSELLDFVSSTRPEYVFVPLPWGFHMTHLFRIAVGSDSEVDEEWVPLLLRFARPYARNTDVHIVQFTETQLQAEAIVVSSAGTIYHDRAISRKLTTNRHYKPRCNSCIRTADFSPRGEMFGILEGLWRDGRRRPSSEWMKELCIHEAKAKWQQSVQNIRRDFLDPLGLALSTPGNLLSVATLLIDGQKAVLRTVRKNPSGQFAATVGASAGRRNDKRPLSTEDEFDLIFLVVPPGLQSSVARESGRMHCMLFPKRFAADEGWISSEAGGRGIMTVSLYPPHVDFTSSPERAAKQWRQAPFYVSNLDDFKALWEALRRESGSVEGGE